MSLIVENLSKRYAAQLALDSISFQVKKGEILGFLGPNGAGKSTMMKIATGYISASQGRVLVMDQEVEKQSKLVRKQVGYLPEHNPLYLEMFVWEYLQFLGRLHGLGGRKLAQRIREMIELCGLGREQKKKIGALSKGYRQRVGLAQSLLHDPPVLILDEPTTGLDVNQIVEIRKLIKEIGREKTVVFSTHIMQEVQAVCNRVIIINLGKIEADSSVEALEQMQKAEQSVIVELKGAVDLAKLEALPGVISVAQIKENTYKVVAEGNQDMREPISQLALGESWLVLGLEKEKTSLENIFQNLTQSKSNTAS
ncbi:MAG: gliding motility-associated ABC transporter ATP-binding subunit GldA [Bacteroidota bacterium]